MGRAAHAGGRQLSAEPVGGAQSVGDTAPLQRFLDDALGDRVAITVTPMIGGGSCEVFARRPRPSPGGCCAARRATPARRPRTTCSASSAILDAIKDEPVAIARPVVALRRRRGVRRAVLRDGAHRRVADPPVTCPSSGRRRPRPTGSALEELVDALVAIHAVDWRACGLGRPRARSGDYLPRQLTRWLAQLDSYDGRDLPAARRVAEWLDAHRPADQPRALCHGDYKLDNVLFAPEAPPHLLAVVDWEMAAIGDPLVDLAWALIFHPGPEGTMRLGMAKEPRFDLEHAARSRQPRRALRHAIGPGHDRDRLVRRVRPLEAGHRARGQLREVPPRAVRQADPRVLRGAGGSAARERRRTHRTRRRDVTRRPISNGAPDAGVAGAGRRRTDRRAARGRARRARARAGPGPHPRRRRRASGCPTCSCAAAPTRSLPRCRSPRARRRPASITAVGDGRRPCRSARGSCASPRSGWGTAPSPRSASYRADSAFPVPDGLTDAEAAGFWIPHLTGWIGLVDRGHLARRRLARRPRRGGRERDRGRAARPRPRRAGHRRRERRGTRRVLSRARRRRDARTTATVRIDAGAPRGHRWARRRRRLRPGRRFARRGRAPARWPATAGCSRSASRAANGRRSATHDLVVANTSLRRRVRRRVLARRARRHPREPRRDSSPTAGCATRCTEEVPFDDAARRRCNAWPIGPSSASS